MSDDSFKNKLYKLSKSEQEEIDIALSKAMETPLESIDKKAFAGNRMSTPPAYQEDNYYPGLKPVIDDEARPLKYRKARKKGWVYAQASYGVPKRHNEAQLRQLGETWVAQRCKSIIIDEVLSSNFKIVPTNDQDFSAETQRKIKQLNIFFESMNREGRTLDAVLRPFLNDVLDLGYGIMVKEFHNEAYEAFNPQNQNRLKETIVPHQTVWSYVSREVDAGLLREVETFDASTFFIQPDYYGREIGWWQRMRNGMPEFFSKREIATMEAYQVSYDEYPISPMKVVAVVVDALMKAVDNTNQFLTDGAIPPGMITLSGISEPEFRKFRDRWNAKYKGNPSQIPLVSAGEGNIEWLPLVANSDDIKQADLIDIYGRIVMSVFHVTPAELGITDAVNKSSAEQQSAVQQRSAIFPFLDRTEDMINRHIVREFDAEASVKFVWDRPQTISDKQAEWNLKKSMLDSGYYTINDFKKAEGEILKAYGHNPFSLGQWIGTAMQTQPQLFGLPQQEESEDQRKLKFVNEQLVYLLESMQHSLNSDKDLTPSAIETLVKLRMMKEGLDTGTRLVGRPQSVIESDNIYDLQNVNNEYSNTQGVFNYLNEQQSLDEEEKGYDDGWVKKGVENLSDKEKRFFFVKDEIENEVKQSLVSRRMDRRIDPLVKRMLYNLGFIGRRVYDSLDRILGGLIGSGSDESKYVSPQEVDRTLENLFSPQEFKELTKDAFMEAYSLGYSMNNEGSIKTKIKDIPVEDISRQAKRFMENRSLLIADRELNKYKQTIKEVIDRGMSTSPRLSAQNIKNELKGILPVERMENESKKDFQARKKRWNSELEKVADTEIAMVQNQGRMQQFKDLGVTHFQYYAFRDSKNVNERPFRIADGSKTTCRELHGRVFEIADPTHTLYMPPHHPRCRCTVQGKFEAEGGFSTAEAKKSLRDLVIDQKSIVEKQTPVTQMSDRGLINVINRTNTDNPEGKQRVAEAEAELQKRKKEEGTSEEEGQEGERQLQVEEKPQLSPKQKKKVGLKQKAIASITSRQVGKVFDSIEETFGVGLELKDGELKINGFGVDIYDLTEGGRLSKANSPAGFIVNQVASNLGSLLDKEVLAKGVDFVVQNDLSDVREGLGAKVIDALVEVAMFVAEYFVDKATIGKINDFYPIIDDLVEKTGIEQFRGVAKAFEDYTIKDMAQFGKDLFDKDNWSMGDGVPQFNHEIVDKLVENVELPQNVTDMWNKTKEVAEKVNSYKTKFNKLEKAINDFQPLKNLNMPLAKADFMKKLSKPKNDKPASEIQMTDLQNAGYDVSLDKYALEKQPKDWQLERLKHPDKETENFNVYTTRRFEMQGEVYSDMNKRDKKVFWQEEAGIIERLPSYLAKLRNNKERDDTLRLLGFLKREIENGEVDEQDLDSQSILNNNSKGRYLDLDRINRILRDTSEDDPKKSYQPVFTEPFISLAKGGSEGEDDEFEVSEILSSFADDDNDDINNMSTFNRRELISSLESFSEQNKQGFNTDYGRGANHYDKVYEKLKKKEEEHNNKRNPQLSEQQKDRMWKEFLSKRATEGGNITDLMSQVSGDAQAIQSFIGGILGMFDDLLGGIFKSAEQLVGKEVTTTHTTEAVIPRVIDAREQKIPKILARYRIADSEGKSCMRCQYSQGDQCAKVDGRINPDYVCDKFRKT